MRRTTKLAPLVLGIPLALPFLGVGTAAAASSATANLSPVPLNGSTGSGTGMATVNGTTLSFTLAAQRLAAGPHAAHIHFGAQARHECPGAMADTNKDGRVSTTEGGPDYGPIVVSLTKVGDTSPASALAVTRFASGPSFSYERGSVPISRGVAEAIMSSRAVVVVHGVAYSGTRAKAKSDLMPSLPASATDPAICGRLVAAPTGGAATGAGGAAAQHDLGLAGVGGAVLLAAAGAGAVAVRRSRA